LFLFALGTKHECVDILINALTDISKRFYDPAITYTDHHYNKTFPELEIRPRSAFHAPLKQVKLEDAKGEVSKEAVMIYPPGIPIIVPGEKFNDEVINMIQYYKQTGVTVISENDGCDTVNVVDKEKINIPAFDKTIE
jgi:arginine decarboxylase